MKLSGVLADKIAARYRHYSGDFDFFKVELNHLLRKRGLAILTEDARRDLIVALGDGRRARNWCDARERERKRRANALPMAAE